MSEEIIFTYYLDGERVEKEVINWESNITVRVVKDTAYVYTNTNNQEQNTEL